ncbi:MAG: response regulator transcription factor, partial [Chloroflexota bacterium]|nr:response regulator transcription factor [Chloroflexota bacterium]
MQKMRAPGDRAGRQARRRSAVWLVPNPTSEVDADLNSAQPEILGALALDGTRESAAAPICVVIVEDAPDTARLLSRALGPAASATRPAITLIDASQPGADGAEVYRQTRALSQTRASHIIFITTSTALELSARGVDGGVLLRAPFEVEQVVALVDALVG